MCAISQTSRCVDVSGLIGASRTLKAFTRAKKMGGNVQKKWVHISFWGSFQVGVGLNKDPRALASLRF